MTRHELKELSRLNAEASLIQKRIDEIETALKSQKIVITGLPLPGLFGENIRQYEHQLEELKERYSKKLSECFSTLDKLNDFIESIPDSEMRMIFSLRYINNLPWQALTWHLGYDGDGSTERKKHDRYLARLNKKCA